MHDEAVSEIISDRRRLGQVAASQQYPAGHPAHKSGVVAGMIAVVKSDAVLDTIRMYTKVLISPQVGTNAGACEAPSE